MFPSSARRTEFANLSPWQRNLRMQHSLLASIAGHALSEIRCPNLKSRRGRCHCHAGQRHVTRTHGSDPDAMCRRLMQNVGRDFGARRRVRQPQINLLAAWLIVTVTRWCGRSWHHLPRERCSHSASNCKRPNFQGDAITSGDLGVPSVGGLTRALPRFGRRSYMLGTAVTIRASRG